MRNLSNITDKELRKLCSPWVSVATKKKPTLADLVYRPVIRKWQESGKTLDFWRLLAETAIVAADDVSYNLGDDDRERLRELYFVSMKKAGIASKSIASLITKYWE